MQDIEPLLELHEELGQYMKAAPVFFIAQELSKEYFKEWLDHPDRAIWLAYVNKEPVAFIRMGPANDDVCTVIYDEKTTSIYGAFTQEAMRGNDIATALLAHAIDLARKRGYER